MENFSEILTKKNLSFFHNIVEKITTIQARQFFVKYFFSGDSQRVMRHVV